MGKEHLMPVLFVGHGSPMNAIEDNAFTRGWQQIASKIPKPRGILMVSAHWYTSGTRVNDTPKPVMVYDMYGFPDELYRVQYPAQGNPELAYEVVRLLNGIAVVDNSWGHDHGSWSVLKHMYPNADIPLIQLSVDYSQQSLEHYQTGKLLKPLREEGILIIGSGNIVHNLPEVRFDLEGGLPWAYEFDALVKENILKSNHRPLLDYPLGGTLARLAIPTPDHYYPLLYILGASTSNDHITIYNESCVFGTLSMTSYLFADA